MYSGEGAGARSVQSAVQTLQSTLRLGPPDKPAMKVPGCAAWNCVRHRCMQAVVTTEICQHSALHAIVYLILVLFDVMEVKTLGTADLLAGSWRRRCLMLVMPGGADLPYCRHLNGAGNDLISGGTLSMSMSSMKRHLLEVASMSVRSAGDCSNNAT